ncbi:hypothetical protein H8D79_00785 [PVC group bacterium]|nr:hypothetical protein [PVC group bacterium]
MEGLRENADAGQAAHLADLLLERGRSYVLTAQANRATDSSASPAEWRQLAIQLYAFVLRNAKTAPVARRCLARLREDWGSNAGRAAKWLGQIEPESKSIKTLVDVEIAKQLDAAGQAKAALDRLEPLLRTSERMETLTDSERHDLYQLAARLYLVSGKPSEGLRACEAGETIPGSEREWATFRLRTAIWLDDHGKLDEAEGEYLLVAERNPDLPEATQAMAFLLALYRRQADTVAALDIIDRRMEVETENPDAMRTLVRLARAHSTPEQSIERYRKFVDRFPRQWQAHWPRKVLADMLLKAGNREEAALHYRKTAVYFPKDRNSPNLIRRSADLYRRAGCHEDAISAYVEGIKLFPKHTQAKTMTEALAQLCHTIMSGPEPKEKLETCVQQALAEVPAAAKRYEALAAKEGGTK